MRTRNLTELIDQQDPAWPVLQQWLAGATNLAIVLPVMKNQAAEVLLHLQITTRSMMGAVAFETGGMWLDNGWLRFLGSGASQMPSTLLSFNGLNEQAIPFINGAFVVAYDIVGGFFAINGGAFPGPLKNIFYLAPDTLAWEDLGRSYADLLYWALYGDLALFYRNARWDGWQVDIAALHGDQGFSLYPPLWTAGPPLLQRHRRIVAIHELWKRHIQGATTT